MRNAAIGCTGALVLLVLAVVGLAAFGSKDWTVARSVVIERPPADVHAEVADLRRWVGRRDPAPARGWSTWIQDANPTWQYEFQGEPGAGQSVAWTSDRDLVCHMTITRADPQTGIEYDLVIDGFPSSVQGVIAYQPHEAVPGATLVTWTTTGERTDMLGGFFARVMDPVLGTKVEQDLRRLRDRLRPPE